MRQYEILASTDICHIMAKNQYLPVSADTNMIKNNEYQPITILEPSLPCYMWI